MDNHAFVYVGYIATTPEKLWNALTQGEFTRQYWYDRRIESEWNVGAPVRFYDGGSDTVTDYGEVLVWDPYREMAYTFQYVAEEGEGISDGPSRVKFTLEAFEDAGVVKLTLVHDKLGSQEMVDGFREGWGPILSSLKTFLETGKPLPQLKHFEAKAHAEE